MLPAEALRPVEEVAAPRNLVNLPVQAELFVGREKDLSDLERALDGQSRVVVAAVHGLGGIGKSTLAARYAMKKARSGTYNPVWWITADSPASIEAGLAELAAALQPELADVLPSAALTKRAIAWLACHSDWLLLLDNVTKPDHVADLVGRISAGKLLVTSRLGAGWHRLGASVLRLDVLSEKEAVDLLTRIVTHDGTDVDLDGAKELVRELGCLPLAIEQAGAYIHQNRLSPRAYLGLLQRYPAQMFEQVAQGGDSARTIARVWRVTLDQLTGIPLAGDLLRVLAWYGPEAIPHVLLEGFAEPPQLQQALGALSAYNMINNDRSAGITVHRLVQAVTRTPDPADPHRRPEDIRHALHQAITLISAALPSTPYNDPTGWPRWRPLVPHIAALVAHAPADTETVDIARLFNESGLFLIDQGDARRAIDCFERALDVIEKVRGHDHPDTLTSRNNLAYAYGAAGDLNRAIPLFERTLADRERILGPNHPDTLTSRNNLAYAYRAAGDLNRAIPLFERTLADAERILGPNHPNTLTSRNNLAGAYRAAGDLKRAIPLFERTLADAERILGPNHPNTLTSRNNLAYAYESAGDLNRAIPLYERTLADRERILGPKHPNTLTSRNNLAGAYRAAGDLNRAIPLYERTLADAERILGPNHPDTLTSRNNLAYAYESAGDLNRAIPLYERALADAERVLGDGHPITETVRSNLRAVKDDASGGSSQG